jgi:malate dehydrogenase (oxaloacetate-decarboxylating)(NADP+)
VVTNGTAVLGLGHIGALAGKPVMEGKAVLFKRLPTSMYSTSSWIHRCPMNSFALVKLMAPTFGGINLEDIKAPDCFYIEEQLKAQMSIPVFHDDQHGTAIISAAAMLNALAITDRRIEDLQVVINGAGAAGIACGKLYIQLGVPGQPGHGGLRWGDLSGTNGRHESLQAGPGLRHGGTHLEEAVDGADMLVGCR